MRRRAAVENPLLFPVEPVAQQCCEVEPGQVVQAALARQRRAEPVVERGEQPAIVERRPTRFRPVQRGQEAGALPERLGLAPDPVE